MIFTALLTALFTPAIIGAGATALFCIGKRSSPIPGLLFHSILPKGKPGPEMSFYPLGRFEKLCSEFNRLDYKGITLNETAVVSRGKKSGEKPILITFDDGFESVYLYAYPVLERYDLKATIFCLGGFFGKQSSWDVFCGKRHLTKEQIRCLSEKGYEIGSHTCSHAYLPYLDNIRIRRELSESKYILEDIIGKPVTSLSFPFGGWSRRIWDIARETGYKTAALYCGRSSPSDGLFSVEGVYRFDSNADIISRLSFAGGFSTAVARTQMMSHFARGTPLWKYRKTYSYV